MPLACPVPHIEEKLMLCRVVWYASGDASITEEYMTPAGSTEMLVHHIRALAERLYAPGQQAFKAVDLYDEHGFLACTLQRWDVGGKADAY